MRIFRNSNPHGKFLVMVRVYGEVPELEGDRYVVGADGPDALVSVLNDMQNTARAASSAR